jgi:hypothetical protein
MEIDTDRVDRLVEYTGRNLTLVPHTHTLLDNVSYQCDHTSESIMCCLYRLQANARHNVATSRLNTERHDRRHLCDRLGYSRQ